MPIFHTGRVKGNGRCLKNFHPLNVETMIRIACVKHLQNCFEEDTLGIFAHDFSIFLKVSRRDFLENIPYKI